MKSQHIVCKILPNSIAEELEIEIGDELVSIDDQPIEDIFDYQFLTEEEELTLLIRKPDGEEIEWEIEKDADEDLGLVFDNGLMDDYRSCSNKCIFCFIDQMPKGMRDTLYFKDDDSRLSFLQGNYITLTNLSDKDLERIVRYNLSPINISIHTMNPSLRCEMLHNKFAGEALKKIDYLHEHNVEMNGQIVLCKGYNDGEELTYTIERLEKYCPVMKSVSIVPVGLTKYRKGLCKLEPFTKEDACKLIELVESYQEKFFKAYGLHFIHLSDEFYILAGKELPSAKTYDNYLQLENGVGMVRLLLDETAAAIKDLPINLKKRELSIATGHLAAPFLEKCLEMIKTVYPNITVHLYPITNYFFGEQITVAGLITGTDLKNQLIDKPLGEALLIPIDMLRSGEDVFLDDLTVSDIEKALQVPIFRVKSSGQDLVYAIAGDESFKETDTHGDYEPSGL
ncbi:Fe-S oxidoreductase [Lachnospiraceae bacterium TWA4]|nr:Fe-S oxidoreductase [Lachnospiraceae bacterium TWA4]